MQILMKMFRDIGVAYNCIAIICSVWRRHPHIDHQWGRGENIMALWGSITLFQKRNSVVGLHNVFSKALLRYKKSRRYGAMEVCNASFIGTF